MGREITARIQDVEPKRSKRREGGLTYNLIGEHGEGMWVHVMKMPPGETSEAHYHEVDQYQIVIEGSAVMAGHEEMLPGTVHYTDANTPYGPFTAGPDGLTLMVIRPVAEGKGKRIPTRTVIDKVRAVQERALPAG